MDQLASPPVVTNITNTKTDKAIKKKAASFFNKFSLQKSIDRERRSLSKQNQTQLAMTENQNLSVLPANLSAVSGSLDNQQGDDKSMKTTLPISQPREQHVGDSSFIKKQNDNTFTVTTATSTPLPLCHRMTKLYQFGQASQSHASASDRNAKNNSIKYPTIPSSRKQLYPLVVQKSYHSNSTPLKLHTTTLDAMTEVDQPYTKNKTEQCNECHYINARSQSKDGFNRQGNLAPIQESSQIYSRGTSPLFEKDPQSLDSKHPDSTSSRIYCRSDEDEAITPPMSECNLVQWTSTDSAIKNRYYKSRSKSHGDYLITIMDPEAFPDAADSRDALLCASEPSSSTSSYFSQNDSDRTDLDRSTSVSSLASSCSSNVSKSTINISQVSPVSSKSIFGKSEFQKKESKAKAMWHSTVQNLIMQRKAALSLDRQPEKPKNTEKSRAIVRFIINELYTTEKSYYHFLTCIRSNYMEPMQIASQLKNPLVKPSDVHVLFYHLPDLVSMSEKLLYNLEMYLEGDLHDVTAECPGEVIGRIFKDLEQELVVFLKYAIHYQGHMKSIRRASTTGYVMNIDRTSRREHNNYNRLGLADYLIAPFQRVPRYELLLKDLLKHTSDTDTNMNAASKTNDLIHALDIVNGLAVTMNLVQEKISMSLFSVSFYSNLYSQSSTHPTLQQTSS